MCAAGGGLCHGHDAQPHAGHAAPGVLLRPLLVMPLDYPHAHVSAHAYLWALDGSLLSSQAIAGAPLSSPSTELMQLLLQDSTLAMCSVALLLFVCCCCGTADVDTVGRLAHCVCCVLQESSGEVSGAGGGPHPASLCVSSGPHPAAGPLW